VEVAPTDPSILRHDFSFRQETYVDHSAVRAVDLRRRMPIEDDNDAIRALEIGTLDDASAAIARLLAVTGATMGRRAQLEGALQSRIVIEQAKGIVAERHGLDVEEAFDVLRHAARANRIKLRDLVQRVRPDQPDPPELARELESLRRDA
jgi:ANTAR domain-containing protein